VTAFWPADEQPRTSAPATSTFAKHSVRFIKFIFHPRIDQLPFSLRAVSVERLTAGISCSLAAKNLDTKIGRTPRDAEIAIAVIFQ
jgi:hypothetical protein